MSAEAGVLAGKHVDYALRAKRETEGEIETVRHPGVVGSAIICVALKLCSVYTQRAAGFL